MLKDVFRGLLLLLAGIVLAAAAMMGVYLLPTGPAPANIAASSAKLSDEETYPQLANGRFSQLDNFTDALMLAEAAYQGHESLTDRAMNVYRVTWSGTLKSFFKSIV